MNRILCLLSLLFTFNVYAASTPKEDPNCAKIGEFAKGVALIRETGFGIQDMQNFVSEPTVQRFPLQVLKTQIYDQNLSAQVARDTFYNKCVMVGYDKLFEYLTHEQERVDLLIKNSLLEEKVKRLENTNTELSLAIQLNTPKAITKQRSGNSDRSSVINNTTTVKSK